MKSDFDLFHLDEVPGWKKLRSDVVNAGKHVSIEHTEVSVPGREEPVRWTIVNRKAAVAFVPVLEDGRFVLIEQDRVPVQRRLWEFPAGQVDVPPEAVTHDDVRRAVISELAEETGGELIEGGTLEPLGYYFPSAGFTQEVIYMFLVHPVRLVSKPQPVGNEHISEVRCVTFDELTGMVARNEITASSGLALYAKLAVMRAKETLSPHV